MELVRLSPSTLNLFADCGRCFWLHINKSIHRPSGPFPSLPGGMDNVLKPYYDKFRTSGKLPPEIEGKVEGKLFPDLAKINRWRNWRTGLEYFDHERNAKLIGALDDLLLVDGGKYAPLDYKTRGSLIKDDSHTYYRLQLDLYALLLKENNLPPAPFGYLIFYSPKEVLEGALTRFTVEPVKVGIDAEAGRAVFEKAIGVLKGEIPPHHSSCTYGLWQNGNF
ncbi:MAG: hypothetical protein A2126_00970 [Candidatus Woykebacteria bacterium GWB1_45_5]|uniref:PD-(D/E)XK endonuclease-like domain-containing protein n=2 Tax=Candidatus Woykeibacteriota TaxID=1817899 RepID=A0A1G1W2N9_9BACT|nr:MAG: hypothetical protein A2113_01355 [Candidatus Woykebacteria bacterium GWA1_44_8]OGY23981.1 MAG: hypothetical protein A2126_00970 [Candidatus Woykebacteria bacterium GWB1_45_5]